MRQMGFEDQWIHLIIACVRSVTYSILINEIPQGRIIPTKGLQQCDSLSIYLFLFCAKGLSTLITKGEMETRSHA